MYPGKTIIILDTPEKYKALGFIVRIQTVVKTHADRGSMGMIKIKRDRKDSVLGNY